jgi:hypothetical protein
MGLGQLTVWLGWRLSSVYQRVNPPPPVHSPQRLGSGRQKYAELIVPRFLEEYYKDSRLFHEPETWVSYSDETET